MKIEIEPNSDFLKINMSMQKDFPGSKLDYEQEKYDNEGEDNDYYSLSGDDLYEDQGV